MKFKILLLFLLILQVAKSQNYTISGYVEDLNTGERIIGAYVVDSISKRTVYTNNFGYYALKNMGAKAAIRAQYFGFFSVMHHLQISKDTILNQQIYSVGELKEVEIKFTPYTQSVNSLLGVSEIPVTSLTIMPALGEPDLLKSIQNQPGIKGGLEGSSGIFVRGGGAGENLFMLDDVPIYNVSHLYGFFSAFNSNAVKDIKLVKGCFPAYYGGRVSSVVDVRTRDGNNKSINGVVSLGLVSSSFTLDGPLTNDKNTFLISGRRSYFDLLSKPLKSFGVLDNDFPVYHFYDLNVHLAHTFSQKDKTYLNVYIGKDDIKNTSVSAEYNSAQTSYNESRIQTSGWGNMVSSLRWNHMFNNSLFANTTMAYSNYSYYTNTHYNGTSIQLNTNSRTEKSYLANYTSNINDLIFKSDFDYSSSTYNILRFGLGNAFHSFSPGNNQFRVDDQTIETQIDTSFSNDIILAQEPYLYIENSITAFSKLTFEMGLRFSGILSCQNRQFNLEPRVDANYALFPEFSIKVGYSRMVQYMHLLSSYGVSMPTDIWVPALKGINPLKSDQINFGFGYHIEPVGLFSVEVYQKWLSNTADFSNGLSLVTDITPWFQKVTQGKGFSKGLEASLVRQEGRLKGTINYTLSTANRKYIELNNGHSFPFKYDRLHDLSISANYQLSSKWDFSALWVYGTGYPITLPSEKYLPALSVYNLSTDYGGEIDYYSSRNNYRLPVYHRLDLSLHYNTRNRWGIHALSFDIFNVYNRKNPVSMYYSGDRIKTLSYSSLLPVIPSVTYTFKF